MPSANGVAVEGSSLSGAPRGARLLVRAAARCTGAVVPAAGAEEAPDASEAGRLPGAGGAAGRSARTRRTGPDWRRAAVRRGPTGRSWTTTWGATAPGAGDTSDRAPVAARWTAGPEVVRPPEPPGDRVALLESDRDTPVRPTAASAVAGGTTVTRRINGISRATAERPVSVGVTTGAVTGFTAR